MRTSLTRYFIPVCLSLLISLAFAGDSRGDQKPSADRASFREVRSAIIKSERIPPSRLNHLTAYPFSQRDYDVTYYRLDLTVDEVQETVGGEVFMIAKSRVNGLSSVDVDLYNNMQVDSVKSSGQSLSFTHSNDIVTSTLPAPVNQGDSFLLRFFYSGTPQSTGFGSFGFDTHDGGTPMIWSLSEPDGARTWWPCNDDPSDKADSADVYLTVNDQFTATSEGVLESTVDNGDGTKTFHWKEHYPITTYLISLAITDYQSFTNWYVTAGGDSMPVTHYVYPEDYNDALVDFAVTPSMIAFDAETFGEYPFVTEKYGHSEFPWGGAMEHQTNTSYGSWLITGDHYFDMVIAHELSHQWWGDMITCETWEDLWLNEGFASYCEALWAEHLGGFTAYRNYMIDMDDYFYGGNFQGPVYDPSQLFNTTVYDKGGWVLHMLRHVISDSTFFQGFWNYGHDPSFQYGTATTADFQNVMETTSGMDLDWFFQEWVYGVNRPYYQYWWVADSSGGNYQLTVHIDQIQQNAPVFRMPLDLQVTTASGESTFTVIDSLGSQDFAFTIPENPQQVDLDKYNWVLKHVQMVPSGGIGGDGGAILPRSLALHQNYPNPFNPSTTIVYDIPEGLSGDDMSLTVYDVRGREIRDLEVGPATSGRHQVAWNGRDDMGRLTASGIYLYRLVVGNGVETKRMLLMK